MPDSAHFSITTLSPLRRYAATPLRRYAVGLPHHINLDHIVVRPVAQAASHKLIREA